MAQPELVIQLEEEIDPEGSQANLEGVDDDSLKGADDPEESQGSLMGADDPDESLASLKRADNPEGSLANLKGADDPEESPSKLERLDDPALAKILLSLTMKVFKIKDSQPY